MKLSSITALVVRPLVFSGYDFSKILRPVARSVNIVCCVVFLGLSSTYGTLHANDPAVNSIDVKIPDFSSEPDICSWPDTQTLAAILPVATDHGSHASGVVFDTNRVLTAAHAVQGGGRFYVKIKQHFRAADLMVVDHAHDLAVLAVNTETIAPLALDTLSPTSHHSLWAAGYPKARPIMISRGVLQYDLDGALHTSAPIDSGQSGGGLLACRNGRWLLAGLLKGYGAYWQKGRYVAVKGHSIAIAAPVIERFLRAD